MLSILILIILFIGAYSGYKNGVILQLIKTIGYAISLILAFDYYKVVSEYFDLLIPYPSPFIPEANPYQYYNESLIFSMDESYYYLVSFFAIFVIGWLITRFITKVLSYSLARIEVPEPLNGVGGLVLGFVVNYLGVFYLLFILTTIPLEFVQARLGNSFVADTMITKTPMVSKKTYKRFVVDVHEEVEQTNPVMDPEHPEGENSEEESEDNE